MPHKKHSNEYSHTLNKYVNLRIEKPVNAKNDVLSGLTVALALVPEAIAFSFVCGETLLGSVYRPCNHLRFLENTFTSSQSS